MTIIDQGYGFDPNSTLAVALYPHNPIAYYSFDANESLFGSGPLKPTSGFNNSILKGFKHYWQLNEENATTFESNAFQRQFDRQCIPDNSIRSYWGIKHKAIRVQLRRYLYQQGYWTKQGPTLWLKRFPYGFILCLPEGTPALL